MKRIIQVGVGGMGNCWIDRVAESELWESVAYVDTNADNLKAAAARHHIPAAQCFTDLEQALNTVKADALLDVTPQQFRKNVCLAAFEHGLHVMSEKPLADSLENAQAIITAGEKAGRIYMVTQNYRYQPVIKTAREMIANGGIGKVGYVDVAFHKGPHFGGFREEMAFPLVLDMSIHHFDMMRYLLDTDIEAVNAISLNTPWNWNKGEATIMVQAEMTNGIVVNYHGSWIAQGYETPWNANWRFDGATGVLMIENDLLYLGSTAQHGADKRESVKFPETGAIHQARLLELFAEALDTGKEPETSGRRNYNSLATTYAVVRSAKERQRVSVAELTV